MEFINSQLSQIESEGFELSRVKEIYEEIVKQCIESGVTFKEGTHEMMFLNHILVLSKRIVSKELIEEMELCGIEELSSFARNTADSIVRSVLSKNNLEMNKTESFLIATHIEMNKEEENENGK